MFYDNKCKLPGLDRLWLCHVKIAAVTWGAFRYYQKLENLTIFFLRPFGAPTLKTTALKYTQDERKEMELHYQSTNSIFLLSPIIKWTAAHFSGPMPQDKHHKWVGLRLCARTAACFRGRGCTDSENKRFIFTKLVNRQSQQLYMRSEQHSHLPNTSWFNFLELKKIIIIIFTISWNHLFIFRCLSNDVWFCRKWTLNFSVTNWNKIR